LAPLHNQSQIENAGIFLSNHMLQEEYGYDFIAAVDCYAQARLYQTAKNLRSASPMASVNVPADSTIRNALREFGVSVNAEQTAQIREYMRMLLVWNDKINLTAIRDPLEILYRHFCDSMFAATVADLRNCRLADIGSGGGFPGLPLKILVPDATVFLVESNVKKATFLAEVIRSLNLGGIHVRVDLYQSLGEEIAPLDYVCARALGDFAALLNWAGSQAAGAKAVMLWLGERDVEEVKRIPGWEWHKAVPVPKSLRRVLLLGSKSSV
jgi:16S rRNA (guanine(527)-N(7))-methyltransferase RsmG